MEPLFALLALRPHRTDSEIVLIHVTLAPAPGDGQQIVSRGTGRHSARIRRTCDYDHVGVCLQDIEGTKIAQRDLKPAPNLEVLANDGDLTGVGGIDQHSGDL